MNQVPDYRIIRTIGSGVFGYVFQAEDKVTKRRVAIKRVERSSSQLSRQYEILQLVQGSDNIVKTYQIFYTKNQKGKYVQNMIFQYIQDNLESLIERNVNAGTRIPQKDIKSYMYQLLKGLQWIHQKKIAHRDLKPQNILLSKSGSIKICDFGSSKIIDQKGQNTPYIVSRYYRAPELILAITLYSTKIDIWAAGCILAQLFLLTPFFKGKTEGDQMFQIFKVLGSFSSLQCKQFKSQVSYELSVLDDFGSFKKANLSQIFHMVEDKKNFIDLLQKMLNYRPAKRIKAKDALLHPFFSQCQKSQKIPLQSQSQTHIPQKVKRLN